jgi:beta-barrel assembly-enhancing protease
MKNITRLTLILCLLINMVSAQTPSNYSNIKAKGTLPKEVISLSSEKYKAEIAKLEKSKESKKTRKQKKEFSLETHFALDPISDYLNLITQKLVEKEDNALRSKLKVYVLRTQGVNAFATERGNIFVTLGLISKVKNEAQLAFILAHEIIHVRESHNMDMFLETKKYDKRTSNREVSSQSQFDKKLLKKCLFSKELETEADSAGTHLFLKSDYDFNSLVGISDLPFSDDDFDYAIFESPKYQLPTEYKDYAVVDPTGENEHEDDTKHSHPNIGTRKKSVEGILAKATPSPNKSLYLISEQTFKTVQRYAQFEVPMLALHNGDLPVAVYTAGELLKTNPDNIYLKKCIAKSLYLHAKYTNDDNYSYHDATDKIEGASQSVYNLFDTMSTQEINALAIRYIWQLSKDLPNDSEVKTLKSDIVYEVYCAIGSLDEFTGKVTTAADTIKQEEEKKENSDGKKKARRSKTTNTIAKAGTVEYWRFALDEYRGEELTTAFDEAKKRKEAREKRNEEREASSKKDKKRGLYLGVDKVVIVNPDYLNLSMYHDIKLEHLKSESGQQNLNDLIAKTAKAAHLEAEILDVKDLKESDIDKFNDIRFINEWYSEQIDYADLSITPGLNQAKIDSIVQKYGTKFFVWTGAISMRTKLSAVRIIFTRVLFPPMLLKSNKDILYYSVIYDITTGARDVVSFTYSKSKAQNNYLKAFLFDSFNQIKKKRK